MNSQDVYNPRHVEVQSWTMVTKNAKKKLELTPVTIYLTPEDHAWLKAHAEEVARQDGEPTSMTKVVRRAVVQYREKIERK